jgi:hypothetical protein
MRKWYIKIRKKYFKLTQQLEQQSQHGTSSNSINSHVSDFCSAEDQGVQFEIHKPERQQLQKSLLLGTYNTDRKFLYSAVTFTKFVITL